MPPSFAKKGPQENYHPPFSAQKNACQAPISPKYLLFNDIRVARSLARSRPQPHHRKRAAVLLYGLQLASTNERSITIEPSASSITRALTRSKSGLDLAPRDKRSSTPAETPIETPTEAAYKENL